MSVYYIVWGSPNPRGGICVFDGLTCTFPTVSESHPCAVHRNALGLAVAHSLAERPKLMEILVGLQRL